MNNISSPSNDLFDFDEISGVADSSGKKLDKSCPWFKPRKQFIRHKIWKKNLLELLDKKKGKHEIIEYFGLPGADLLDLDYFSQTLNVFNQEKQTDFKLKFKALIRDINEYNAAHERFSTLQDCLTIDNQSNIDRADFDRIINSSARESQLFNLPIFYDFVNLDFCDNVFCTQERLRSLKHLLNMQFGRQSTFSWVLSITTTINSCEIPDAQFASLADNLCEKITNPDTLEEELKILHDELCNKGKKQPDQLGDKSHEVIKYGLIPWILEMAFNEKVKIEKFNVSGYKVYPQNNYNDMYTFTFMFKRNYILSPDPTGISTLETSIARHLNEDEKNRYYNYNLERASKSLNIDEILMANNQLNEELISETASLLVNAGYLQKDVDNYMRQFCNPPV